MASDRDFSNADELFLNPSGPRSFRNQFSPNPGSYLGTEQDRELANALTDSTKSDDVFVPVTFLTEQEIREFFLGTETEAGASVEVNADACDQAVNGVADLGSEQVSDLEHYFLEPEKEVDPEPEPNGDPPERRRRRKSELVLLHCDEEVIILAPPPSPTPSTSEGRSTAEPDPNPHVPDSLPVPVVKTKMENKDYCAAGRQKKKRRFIELENKERIHEAFITVHHGPGVLAKLNRKVAEGVASDEADIAAEDERKKQAKLVKQRLVAAKTAKR